MAPVAGARRMVVSLLHAPLPGSSTETRLRWVRSLSLKTLMFAPVMAALFVVFAVPAWGFVGLGLAVLAEGHSIYSLTRRIEREHERDESENAGRNRAPET